MRSPLRRPVPRVRLVLLVVAVLFSTACEQLVDPIGEGPLRYRDAIFDDVTVTAGIVYGSAVTQQGSTIDLTIDFYEATADTAAARPLIVFIHGGGFSGGNPQSGEIVDQANYFAQRGYTTASISYRLSPGGCGTPDSECLLAISHALEDAQAAIAYLRDNATELRIDTTRIAAAGTSAGAITAVNVAFSNSDSPDSAVRAAVSLSGASVLTTPDPGDAPVLLFHGTNDGLVPYSWAESTISTATANGVRAVLTTWPGAGHVPYVTYRTDILTQTRNFLYWRMDLASIARGSLVG